MKMYSLVKETVPVGVAPVAVAHASLAAYLKYQETPEVVTGFPGHFISLLFNQQQGEGEGG